MSEEFLAPANGCVAFVIFRNDDMGGLYHLFPVKSVDVECEGAQIMQTHRIDTECRCEPIEYREVRIPGFPHIQHFWLHSRWNVAIVENQDG